MHRTASTARPVISSVPHRTSIGLYQRLGEVQLMMECRIGQWNIDFTYHISLTVSGQIIGSFFCRENCLKSQCFVQDSFTGCSCFSKDEWENRALIFCKWYYFSAVCDEFRPDMNLGKCHNVIVYCSLNFEGTDLLASNWTCKLCHSVCR